MNETTSEATDDVFAAGAVLVKTAPATMLGAIALLQYVSTIFDEDGIESSTMPETVDAEPWPVVLFRTLASALAQVQP